MRPNASLLLILLVSFIISCTDSETNLKTNSLEVKKYNIVYTHLTRSLENNKNRERIIKEFSNYIYKQLGFRVKVVELNLSNSKVAATCMGDYPMALDAHITHSEWVEESNGDSCLAQIWSDGLSTLSCLNSEGEYIGMWCFYN
jgi:hypothetical protein